MLPVLFAAAALGHSYHTARDGTVVFNDHPDTGRIVYLEKGEVIRLNVTAVKSVVVTPAFRDYDAAAYEATCLGGTVTKPTEQRTDELDSSFQIPTMMPWPKEAVTTLDCAEPLEIRGSQTMLVFLGTVDRWTFAELMARGAAVLDLHDRWNDALFTYPLSLASAGLVVTASFWLSSAYGGPPIAFDSAPRYYLYVAAIIAFAAAAVEGIIHCGISQFRLPGRATEKLAEGLAVVILPNAVAIAIILVSTYVPWSRNWALLELITAFSMFLFFYAGLYVGPSLWMAAALVRLVQKDTIYS